MMRALVPGPIVWVLSKGLSSKACIRGGDVSPACCMSVSTDCLCMGHCGCWDVMERCRIAACSQTQGATGPQRMAGLHRFRARACQGAPHKSNVEVIQSTGALSKCRSGPGRTILTSRRGHVPRGAMPGLSYPGQACCDCGTCRTHYEIWEYC